MRTESMREAPFGGRQASPRKRASETRKKRDRGGSDPTRGAIRCEPHEQHRQITASEPDVHDAYAGTAHPFPEKRDGLGNPRHRRDELVVSRRQRRRPCPRRRYTVQPLSRHGKRPSQWRRRRTGQDTRMRPSPVTTGQRSAREAGVGAARTGAAAAGRPRDSGGELGTDATEP